VEIKNPTSESFGNLFTILIAILVQLSAKLAEFNSIIGRTEEDHSWITEIRSPWMKLLAVHRHS